MMPAQRRRLLTSGWVPKVGLAADPVDDATECCDEKKGAMRATKDFFRHSGMVRVCVGTAVRVGSE
jgi:hypothetical protein